MKRNGMCPICFVKQFLGFRQKVSTFSIDEDYQNEICPTPPMGWSSWNTFRNIIDEDLFLETAKAMKDKGLLDAGYKYINLDDCWHSSLRDEDGNLQGDLVKFKRGIKPLVEDINKLGFKVGIYSSNGTYTCEDLPASLGNEQRDANIFASWGIEYFKYDYCHHSVVSKYAPLIYAISIAKDGDCKMYDCTSAKLDGLARFMPDKKVDCKKHISGLDAGFGSATFDNIYVEEEGDYVLTIHIRKHGANYHKFLQAKVNDKKYFYDIPPQQFFNNTARFQKVVHLVKGINTIQLSNPISNRADGAFYQYYNMGQCLKKATQGKKPIVYSICEWGFNKPYMWGRKAGNLWRTTPDIRPIWPWIKIIYSRNVIRHEFSGVGSYNDPDMLEVGNGKLTQNQNRAHFSLWCMMNAPLVLGNDIRSMSQSVLDIVTNKDLIAINQDPLAKQCKRVKKGLVDILAKPLANGSVAVCFFNKSAIKLKSKLDLNKLANDTYVNLDLSPSYDVKELWSGDTCEIKDTLLTSLPKASVKVYMLTPKK